MSTGGDGKLTFPSIPFSTERLDPRRSGSITAVQASNGRIFFGCTALAICFLLFRLLVVAAVTPPYLAVLVPTASAENQTRLFNCLEASTMAVRPECWSRP